MSARRASALIVSSVTGAGNGATARMSTHFQRESSAVEFGVGLGDHLDDADHGLLAARVVEEAEVALLHRDHVVAGLEVADAVPFLAGGALRGLGVPAPGLGLGLEEPVVHVPPLFLAQRPGEQRLHRRRDRRHAVEHVGDGGGDRQLDAGAARQAGRRRARSQPLRRCRRVAPRRRRARGRGRSCATAPSCRSATGRRGRRGRRGSRGGRPSPPRGGSSRRSRGSSARRGPSGRGGRRRRCRRRWRRRSSARRRAGRRSRSSVR